MFNRDKVIRLEFAATHQAVRTLSEAIEALLAGTGVAADESYNVQLAAHEVCTNQVDHAYQGQDGGSIHATLTLKKRPRCLVVQLEDEGQPFDPASAAAPNLDEPQEGGYGLFLAGALMDEVHYERRGETNCWRLVKNW